MTPLEEQISELWGHIMAATHRFLELVAQFDDSKIWAGGGLMSCAQWLNIYCGIGIVTAREKVRVAHAMRELPEINAAFRDGRVSYSKVRAMTRIATPENESVLLSIALHGTASHVERTVKAYRRVERIEEARQAAEAQRDRFVNFRRSENDRDMVIYGRVPIDVGELVRKAMERAMDLAELRPEPVLPMGEDDSAESRGRVERAEPEDRYRFGAARADALALIADRFLAVESERTGSSSDRYQVVVQVDQHVLTECVEPRAADNDETARPARCELEDGPAIAVATARRLGCGGSLVGVVDGDDGEPLAIGRKTRAVSPALRRALKARDGGCRFPGCTHTRYTQSHHVVHWADGGETKLENLITLCHFHHHLVHEGGFGVERTDDGLFVFTTPEDRILPEHHFPAGRFCGIALAALNRDRDVVIRPDTVVTRWQGERMDYSMAIDCLLAQRARRERHLGALREPV
jgi:hypothetical protein